MHKLLNVPQRKPASPRNSPLEQEVRTQVWALLRSLYPRGNVLERRSERRYAYPYLIHVGPVAGNGASWAEEDVIVVGKQISERGLSFYHPKPLPHRRMIVSLETMSGSRLRFLIDLTWCRFTRQGWYESGGRFLQVIQAGEETGQDLVEG
ncbi:MAG: hypothetical protein ACLQNE_09170 [Thermoguttaceae bacterium]